MSILNPSVFPLKRRTNVEDQATRGFIVTNWNLGSFFQDVKINLKVFYMPIDRIHPKSVTILLVQFFSMGN